MQYTQGMETKSAVLGGLSALVAGAIAFSGFAIANADNQPAPAVTTVAPSVAPEPTPEPVVTETPVVEPAVEPAPVEPVVAVPAPVMVEPAPVAPAPVYVAPAVIEPGPVAPAPVYVGPAPVNVTPEGARTFEAPPIEAPGVPNPILTDIPPGGFVDASKW